MFEVSKRLMDALNKLYLASQTAKQAREAFKVNRTPKGAKKLQDAIKEEDRATEALDFLMLIGEKAEPIEAPEPDETEEKQTKTSRDIADEVGIEAARAANERISKY